MSENIPEWNLNFLEPITKSFKNPESVHVGQLGYGLGFKSKLLIGTTSIELISMGTQTNGLLC